ncbi:T9SS type A sorting domain-containing protein [Candidatus Falkowbacteria bacterium]|nr:MAG: T9SS type A sorting domain-containing protein [Candidatus Falkowbacteria bacterium]
MKTIFVFLLMVGRLFAQPFEILPSGVTNFLFDVHFVNASTGYVALNNGSYLKTSNSGVSWNEFSSGSPKFITSFFFINEDKGFAVGESGRVFKTTNSGLNWQISSPAEQTLRNIYFLDFLNGYAVGDFSTVIKTTNGGESWFNQIVSSGDALFTDVMFVDGKGYITVATSLTNLFVSTNNGINWTDGKIRGGSIHSKAIDFHAQSGYFAGYEIVPGTYHPLIFKTSNNGETWNEYIIESRGQLYDIAVSPIDPNKACAVGQYVDDLMYGNKALIMRTINGGETWTEEPWGVNGDEFKGVDATSNDFFIVGRNGVILKTSHSVGIFPINNEIPLGYFLSQNFPNPFNPSTKINFSIPKSGKVKLSVFNMVGKEVVVLLDQSLSAGNYTADFDASNLTSGVYFYTLQSENFTETKRMVLVK